MVAATRTSYRELHYHPANDNEYLLGIINIAATLCLSSSDGRIEHVAVLGSGLMGAGIAQVIGSRNFSK